MAPIFLLLILFNSCSSLLIHSITPKAPNPIAAETLASVYSTLGTRPTTPIESPLVLINQSYVNEATCTFLKNVNGSIVVYTESRLPPMRGCNNDDMGMTTAFARSAQNAGAVALVITAAEQFSGGRVVGFTDSVSIPVVVAPYATVHYIQSKAESILSIRLTAAAQEEEDLLGLLSILFSVWTLVNAALFLVLLFVLAYAIYVDVLALRKAKKYFSHPSFLKWMCFGSALSSFLWHVVDPFNFNGTMWWYSCILKSLMLGFSSIVTLLVLRIWISAPLHNEKFLLMWSVIIYSFVALLFTTSVAYGVLWENTFVIQIHLWSHVASLLLSATGYVYFGRHLVATLYKSGNLSKNSKVLPAKITTFIISYALVAYSLTVVAFLSPTGIILDTLLVSLVVVFLLVAVFVVLFSPAIKRFNKAKLQPVSGRLAKLEENSPKNSMEENSAESIILAQV